MIRWDEDLEADVVRATRYARACGYAGKLADERGHLEARIYAARRRYAASPSDHTRQAMHDALAALERFEEAQLDEAIRDYIASATVKRGSTAVANDEARQRMRDGFARVRELDDERRSA